MVGWCIGLVVDPILGRSSMATSGTGQKIGNDSQTSFGDHLFLQVLVKMFFCVAQRSCAQ